MRIILLLVSMLITCIAQAQTNAPTVTNNPSGLLPLPPLNDNGTVKLPSNYFKTQAKIPIALEIDGTDADEVKSYASRELRSLGDVAIVEKGQEEMTIFFLIMATNNRGGVPTGYAISIVVTSDFLDLFVAARLSMLGIDEPTITRSGLYMENDGTYLNHYLGVCAPDELADEIKKQVAKIDSSEIDMARKLFLKPQ